MADSKENKAIPSNHSDDHEEDMSPMPRWMSMSLVLIAVIGFFGLAWYAYKSGGQAMSEKDVEIVKADKTPVKEPPVNPGGMEIPNQDKTVYNLISNSKNDKQVVERIMPAPENPLSRDTRTETWMSDKLKNKVTGTEEAQIAAQALTAPVVPPIAPAPASGTQTIPSTPAESKPAFKPLTLQAPLNTPTSQTKAVSPIVPKELVKSEPEAEIEAEEEPEQEQEEKPIAEMPPKKAPVTAAKSGHGARIQLGAYKSQGEANKNWDKISSKYSDTLSNKDHFVLRVDLGDKGVFYRLQMGPFVSVKEANLFCQNLVKQGQQCFLARSK